MSLSGFLNILHTLDKYSILQTYKKWALSYSVKKYIKNRQGTKWRMYLGEGEQEKSHHQWSE